MTVYHYYARYLEHPSGVTDSLNHWADALASHGIDTKIVANAGGINHNEFAQTERLIRIRHSGRSRSSWIPRGLGKLLSDGDVLVLHEGWVLSNAIASVTARRKKVPYVVVPHGVYEPQLVEKTRDPLGFRSRVERFVLKGAASIHVFYEGERKVVQAFRKTPDEKKFIVVPNGAPDVNENSAWTGGGGYFLWIGRFDVNHKGLDLIVRYWARLGPNRPRLVLAGPDFQGGREKIRRLITQLGLDSTIELRGRVAGEEKVKLMAECEAYVHPSRWESCSIMLLEMLSIGAPSLISRSIHAATELEPLNILLSEDFAAPSADSAAIQHVAKNEAMGGRAKAWAQSEGSWTTVSAAYAAEMARVAIGG